MSVFKLPKTLLNAINSVIQNLWWGQQDKEHKIHWISWKRIRQAKSKGGLGFRDLECFNTIMLSKRCWRLIQDPNPLVARVLKAKYFPSLTLQTTKVGSKPSFVWRSLMAARHVLEAGSFWRVGTGSEISIWRDKWLDLTNPRKVTNPVKNLDGNAKVAALIDPDTKRWKQ
ncbi:uncharacterized mitochondrial protein AtMg00310-like [Juglans regia]|uniref:Uncharacterized mitochondrial protein AtMg00310-like n=1 Tax=Juglans regia TaxID=51240 RepID=A0A6P9F8U1_JUGRE|nr:uncharacterized mitochondrial protein AtMg00310-like [Juglans regia]